MLTRSRETLVRVAHWARPRKIKRFQINNLKTHARNELVNLAIQVTAASETLPERCHPILPDGNARIGGAAMLQKYEAAAPFQDSLHLLKGA
jgi:hypothetical protein